MTFLSILIDSKIFIAGAAVALTIATQVQLRIGPKWHPYVFLIFFATLFEYNLHRFALAVYRKERSLWLYVLVGCSLVGMIASAVEARLAVLLVLTPFALLTLFYALRFRQIPYVKIFLIATTWSAVTILLPVFQSTQTFATEHIVLLLLERFLFVFAITIPFDIRDMESDKQNGLKTLPLKLMAATSLRLSVTALIACGCIAVFHYASEGLWGISSAMALSCGITIACLTVQRIKEMPFYHYGILDGAMLLQGVLVVVLK